MPQKTEICTLTFNKNNWQLHKMTTQLNISGQFKKGGRSIGQNSPKINNQQKYISMKMKRINNYCFDLRSTKQASNYKATAENVINYIKERLTAEITYPNSCKTMRSPIGRYGSLNYARQWPLMRQKGTTRTNNLSSTTSWPG